MLEELKAIRSLTNFEGVDFFYLFLFLDANREALGDDYERLISLINQSDGSDFFKKYIAKNFNRDVVDAFMEEQLAELKA